MRLLELFCGTKSISKEFSKRGWQCTTLDWDEQFKPDIIADILSIDSAFFKDTYDVIWASPPCNAFSVAVIGKNWNHDGTPKSPSAELGLQILEKTLNLIGSLNPKLWFIENPRGIMRKMPIMEGLPRHTVTYCQYGDSRMKPTDIWTNSLRVPRPPCKNGDKCHIAAPRGSTTGTQGIKGAINRAVIPQNCVQKSLNKQHGS